MSTSIAPERVLRRFWSQVAVRAADECWIWQLSTGSHAYGQVGWWENGHSVMVLAHRVAYELAKGPIPGGLQIDHLCRNRACVNPAHLEPVTGAENVRRAAAIKTHCRHGHEFNDVNTYITTGGHRQCRACARASKTKARERRRAQKMAL